MMAKAPRGASRRTAAAAASPAAPAQLAPINEASTPPAPAPATPSEPPPAPSATPNPVAPVEAPVKSGKVRWLRMETGLSGPDISLARGDKHPFCDISGDDDAPSEAQRLVNAGFAVDCDPPVEG